LKVGDVGVEGPAVVGDDLSSCRVVVDTKKLLVDPGFGGRRCTGNDLERHGHMAAEASVQMTERCLSGAKTYNG
jgi:hypothetical protein